MTTHCCFSGTKSVCLTDLWCRNILQPAIPCCLSFSLCVPCASLSFCNPVICCLIKTILFLFVSLAWFSPSFFSIGKHSSYELLQRTACLGIKPKIPYNVFSWWITGLFPICVTQHIWAPGSLQTKPHVQRKPWKETGLGVLNEAFWKHSRHECMFVLRMIYS